MLLASVQRSQTRPTVAYEGVQRPPLAVSVLVTCAVPEIVGAS